MKDPQTLSLLYAMLAFVGSHFLLSHPPIRTRLIANMGDNVFKGVYSALALATLYWVARAYGAAPYHELWDLAEPGRRLPQIVMPVAFVLLASGLLSRNPTAVGGEHLIRQGMAVRGIFTITRHPFLWGTGLWSLAHLGANGDSAALILFGGMALLSFGGMAAIDHKRAVTLGTDWDTLRGHSSVVPFLAALQGRTTLDWRGIGWWRPLLGLGLYAGGMHGHQAMFGVSALG